MSTIIPLTRLAELLAAKAGIPVEQSSAFITDIFADVETRLASDGYAVLPGIGTFSMTPDKDSPVSFVPDESLAMAVNSPFNAFVPIPLSPDDNVDDNLMPPPPSFIEPEISPAPVPETVEIGTIVEETESVAYNEIPEPPSEEDSNDTPPPFPSESGAGDNNIPPAFNIDGPDENTPPPAPLQQPVSTFRGYTPSAEYVPYSTHEHTTPVRKRKKTWPWVILGILIGLIIGFIGGYLLGLFTTVNESLWVEDYDFDFDSDVLYIDENIADADSLELIETEIVSDTVIVTEMPEVEATDPVESEEASAPQAKKSDNDTRYGTITETTFLTTLSRRNYGEMEYWVYIYDANDLGNPNRIKPGTVVRIPSPDELPLTGNRDEDIANAKKRATEIYAKYTK